MDHALVPKLQEFGFAAVLFGAIPFVFLSFCFRLRWANRVANVLGLLLVFYVTIGQTLWCLPYYGTHWDFGGPMLLADGVTCRDGCRADAITLAVRNYGSPAFVLLAPVGFFLVVMGGFVGVAICDNRRPRR